MKPQPLHHQGPKTAKNEPFSQLPPGAGVGLGNVWLAPMTSLQPRLQEYVSFASKHQLFFIPQAIEFANITLQHPYFSTCQTSMPSAQGISTSIVHAGGQCQR